MFTGVGLSQKFHSLKHLWWLAGWLLLSAFGLTIKAQPARFEISDFTSSRDLLLAGSAAVSGERLLVAQGADYRAGAAWYHHKVSVTEGFECTFRVRVNGPERSKGFALVLHGETLPGLGTGEGLGYDGLRNSLAVEFDFFQSVAYEEPPVPHVSVQTHGIYVNTAHPSASLGATTNAIASLMDGNVHEIRVRYVPGTLEVAVDNTSVLAVKFNLETLLRLVHGQAWIGFTAGSHQGEGPVEIVAWSFVPAAGPVQVRLTAVGTEVIAGATIPLSATASTSTGSIAGIEFYMGEQKIGSATNAPFELQWSNAVPGEHVLTAAAYNDAGNSSVSAPLRIVVLPSEETIGLNFASGLGGTNFSIAPWESAGVVGQSNWNNVLPGSAAEGTLVNALSSSGTPTAASFTYQFIGVGEEFAINPTTSADHCLMRAHVADHGRLMGQTNGVISISDVPYPVYDLILYSDGGNNGYERIVEFRVGGQQIFLRDASWTPFSGHYAEARGTINLGYTTSAGNYVRFRGLTNRNVTVLVSERSSVDVIRRAAVNAVQIVPSLPDVPVLEPRVVRGPYLQSGTAHSMTICWRTDLPTETWLSYGTAPGKVNLVLSNSVPVRDHVVTLTNLQPSTRYYYSIGAGFTNLPPENLTFVTSPETSRSTRIWVWGDGGTADWNAASVRDSFLEYTAERKPDLLLLLGDNAYQNGSDAEYQNAVFDMLAPMLSQTVLWSAMGNHETYSQDLPYLRMFHFPTNGGAGGVPSGSELYYSFNYANIHFVCLETTVADRSSNGPMAQWLREDLAVNSKEWLIVYFHAPPYSKGSHDSDSEWEIEMHEMRTQIISILEEYGADLVLSGNSHGYERSYLIDGHYGFSDTFLPSMIKQPGSGRPEDTGAYVKPLRAPAPHSGTVYVVAGNGGIIRGHVGLNHPAMFRGVAELGSVVIDVDGPTLEFRMLRENGTIADHFTMRKGIAITPRAEVSLMTVDEVLDESASAGTSVLITRSDPGDEDVQVYYDVTGAAENGSDYVRIGNSVTIPAGDTQLALPIVPFDDADHEGDEQISVTLIANTAPFSLALLPDTSAYAAEVNGGTLAMLQAQTRWIAANAGRSRIAFALHAGNLTASNAPLEWQRMEAALDALSGFVPYAVAPGERDGLAQTDLFNAHFPLSDFQQSAAYGGAFESNRSDNTYHYFTGGGVDWLVLALEFGPRDSVLEWANRVIAQHPERKVVVLTHTQRAGIELWHKLLRRHANIALALSGSAEDGSAWRADAGDYGNLVVQISTDFSSELNGGNGYLRLLDFVPAEDKLVVRSYSPYLNAERNRFEVLNLGLFKPWHARYGLQSPVAANITLQDNDADAIAPSVANVNAVGETNQIIVTFSETVALSSAENVNNYQLASGIAILSAQLLADGRTVVLTTGQALPEGTPLELIVSDIKDRAVPPNRTGTSTNSFEHRTVWLYDDFNDGDFAGWTIFDEAGAAEPSIWSVPIGKLDQSSEIAGTMAVWSASSALEWSDYVLRVTICTPDPDDVGVIFRRRDASNYYKLELNGRSGRRSLTVVSNDIETALATSAGVLRLQTNITLEVELSGTNIYATLDGEPLFRGVVSDAAVQRGTVGLYCAENAGVTFDDVEVKPFRAFSFSALDNPAVAPSGRFEFDLVGPPGARFAIEASSDFGTWTELTTVTNEVSGQRLSVPAPNDGASRFYRARRLP